MKFPKLDEKKIREIRKLAADLSLTWDEISTRVGVSPPTCKKYGEPIRKAKQEGPSEESEPDESWRSELDKDPHIIDARKRLGLAELEKKIRGVDETTTLGDRIAVLEEHLAGALEDNLELGIRVNVLENFLADYLND